MLTQGAAHSRTATRSPVYWALLGLIIERPGYGYDLLKRFERTYGAMLPLSSESHIYRGLDVLEEKGLIEEVPGTGADQPGAGRQAKPHYRVTPEGIGRYEDWLISQVGAGRRQSALFVRQLAVLEREPRAALAVLDRLEQSCLQEATSGSAHSADDVSLLATRLASEEKRRSVDATLPWIEYARRELEALAEDGRGR